MVKLGDLVLLCGESTLRYKPRSHSLGGSFRSVGQHSVRVGFENESAIRKAQGTDFFFFWFLEKFGLTISP